MSPWTIEGAQMAAMSRTRCPYWDRRIRGCNLARHMDACPQRTVVMVAEAKAAWDALTEIAQHEQDMVDAARADRASGGTGQNYDLIARGLRDAHSILGSALSSVPAPVPAEEGK